MRDYSRKNHLAVFVLILFFITCLFGQTEKRTLEPDDYAQWQNLSRTAISTDGKWIAYVVTLVDGDDTLFVKNADTEKQYKNALEQAQSELREEALESRLQDLVDEGKMTQEEADSYLEWWQSRPDIEAPLPGLGGPGPGGGMMRGRGFGPPGGPCPGPDSSGE